MKILTLNTHSYLEKDFNKKFGSLVLAILREKFDVIALQEVNQLSKEELISPELLKTRGFVLADESVVKKDNFALQLVRKLKKLGLNYTWSWVNNHVGYDIYDEGVALLTLNKVTDVKSFFISKNQDVKNYKTRKVLGFKTVDEKSLEENWLYSIHMGWWNDKEDPFKEQWECLNKNILNDTQNTVYLMGDFNSPTEISSEGYSLVSESKNWYDTYNLSLHKDFGHTIVSPIDGWSEDKNIKSMRIDLILKNNDKPVLLSSTIFNGKNYPVVSDHFGLYIIEK